MQRRIQRPGVDLQRIARARADHLREAVAVSRPPAQGLEDDEIERALEELDPTEAAFFLGHGWRALWL